MSICCHPLFICSELPSRPGDSPYLLVHNVHMKTEARELCEALQALCPAAEIKAVTLYHHSSGVPNGCASVQFDSRSCARNLYLAWRQNVGKYAYPLQNVHVVGDMQMSRSILPADQTKSESDSEF